MADVIYTIITMAIGIIGIWSFFSLYNLYVPRLKLMRRLQRNKANGADIFRASGLGISLVQYNAIRYAVYVALIAYICYEYFVTKQIPVVLITALITILAVTNPDIPKISLVPLVLKAARNARVRKLNEELLRAFIHLKNLALLDTQLNAYEIMKRLLRHTRNLKPYLSELMKDWHSPDRRDTALERFNTTLATVEAGNFLRVLQKLDTTRLAELLAELSLYEQQILESRQTARERRDGLIGDMFFSLVTLLLMVVLLDFIFVVVFTNISFGF